MGYTINVGSRFYRQILNKTERMAQEKAVKFADSLGKASRKTMNRARLLESAGKSLGGSTGAAYLKASNLLSRYSGVLKDSARKLILNVGAPHLEKFDLQAARAAQKLDAAMFHVGDSMKLSRAAAKLLPLK